jgi:hypothetical protein
MHSAWYHVWLCPYLQKGGKIMTPLHIPHSRQNTNVAEGLSYPFRNADCEAT